MCVNAISVLFQINIVCNTCEIKKANPDLSLFRSLHDFLKYMLPCAIDLKICKQLFSEFNNLCCKFINLAWRTSQLNKAKHESYLWLSLILVILKFRKKKKKEKQMTTYILPQGTFDWKSFTCSKLNRNESKQYIFKINIIIVR